MKHSLVVPTGGNEQTGEEFLRFTKFSQHHPTSLFQLGVFVAICAANFNTFHCFGRLIDMFILILVIVLIKQGGVIPWVYFVIIHSASAKPQPFVLGSPIHPLASHVHQHLVAWRCLWL